MTSRIFWFWLLAALSPVLTEDVTRQPADDCGVNCLFVGLTVLNGSDELSLADLKNRLAPNGQGNSLAQLSSMANELGFQTLAVKTTIESLLARQRPFVFIAHMKRDHFVLISDASPTSVKMVDSPEASTVPVTSFVDAWDGTGLLILNQELEPEESLVSRFWWSQFRKTSIYAALIVSTVALIGFLAKRPLTRWRTT